MNNYKINERSELKNNCKFKVVCVSKKTYIKDTEKSNGVNEYDSEMCNPAANNNEDKIVCFLK